MVEKSPFKQDIEKEIGKKKEIEPKIVLTNAYGTTNYVQYPNNGPSAMIPNEKRENKGKFSTSIDDT